MFLHGWRAQGLVWRDVAARLSESRDFAIYLLDLPGFGGSTLPKTPFHVQDYTNLISGFIEKLDLGKVILIGHSFGGRIATKLAAQKPELVEKLILVDSAGLMTNKKSGGLKFLAKMVKPLFRPKFMKGLREKIYQKIGAEDYTATPNLKETFLKVINEDLSGYLPKVSQPTLIIWGENDKTTPLGDAKIMKAKIKNSQLVVFENAGHSCFLDKPKEFCDELIRFIK